MAAAGDYETVRERTTASILQFVEERRLHAGDRLPSERSLAERLGVGRGTVREALAALAALDLVERRPNSGAYLRGPVQKIVASSLRARHDPPATAQWLAHTLNGWAQGDRG